MFETPYNTRVFTIFTVASFLSTRLKQSTPRGAFRFGGATHYLRSGIRQKIVKKSGVKDKAIKNPENKICRITGSYLSEAKIFATFCGSKTAKFREDWIHRLKNYDTNALDNRQGRLR